MRRRLTLGGGLLVLVLVVGCQLWDSPGRILEDGTKAPGKKGVITLIAEAVSAAGAVVPALGWIGTAVGIIGGAGAFIKNNQNKRNLKGMVELVEKMKPRVKELANDEELEALIVKATEGTKFGSALKKAHAALKKI